MLKSLLRKLNPARSDDRVEDHPSVVILLCEPQPLSHKQAFETAQRAWGASGPVEVAGVLNDGQSILFRAGKLAFALHHAAQRYEIPGAEANDAKLRPWEEHHAWMAIDFPAISTTRLKQDGSLGTFYKLLLVYAFLCWSANCLAVYFPSEGVTVPYLGDLAGSIQWTRKNGVGLDFLNKPS